MRSTTAGILGGGVTSQNQATHSFEHIISVENLLDAWQEFVKGKRKRTDVQEFGRHLMSNVLALQSNLSNSTYRHGGYEHFKVNDPKPRDIHKASVHDRLVHHALYRRLYPFFDKKFIADSYSCRLGKGTHRAMNRFRAFAYKVSQNDTHTCWVLKCDIQKFFASIDHVVLMNILRRNLSDERTLSLLENIIESFHSTAIGKGLPLGNLTSQLLVNIYMNEFDQFVKHKLRAKHYVRYADDFVILSHDRSDLLKLLSYIVVFLRTQLNLELHPNKVSIQTLASGIDFLGWVHFPDHRILRPSTKRRMFRRLKETSGKQEVITSYLGLLSHGNTWKLRMQGITVFSRTRHYTKDMKTEIATFAAGCFWGVEGSFHMVPGVIEAVSGYSGGHVEHPSYEQVCTEKTGHAESVEVTFDPQKVSYEALVHKFFAMHDPTQVNRQGPDVGGQYRSVIFYRTPEQKEIAEKVLKELAPQYYPKTIATSIEPAKEFWKAEEYHQRYAEKHPGRVVCHI